MSFWDFLKGGDPTVTNSVVYPKWYTNAAKDLIQYGNNAGKWLAKPYQGNTVAKLNSQQLQLIRKLNKNVGSTNSAYQQAMNGTRGVMDFQPRDVNARQLKYDYRPEDIRARQVQYDYSPDQVRAKSFLQSDIDEYMNPYIRTVERKALSRLDDQRLLAQSANADAAAAAGAFGGSRQGIREALTDAETSRSAGELSANLRNQGFNTASNLIMQDLDRNLQARLANQQTNLNNAQFGANVGLQNAANNLNAQQFNSANALQNSQFGANVGLQNIANDLNAQQFNSNQDLRGQELNLNAAAQLGNQATDMQNAYLQGVQGSMTGANMQQQQQQNLLNQQMNQYNAMRNYPLEIFNARLAALQGGQIQPSNVQTTSGGGGLASGLMGALGGALAGSSLGPWGMLAGGLGGGLAGFSSDKNAKTNIEKLGKDPTTGLDIFAYDYKSDVKAAKKNGTPMPMKRVGPMAQDIEKNYPGSTRKVSGKMVVTNLGFGG